MTEKLGELDYTKEEYLNLGANYENTNENLKTEIDILNIGEEEKETIEYAEETEEDNEIEETERIEDIELEARFVAQRIKELINNKFQIYDAKRPARALRKMPKWLKEFVNPKALVVKERKFDING